MIHLDIYVQSLNQCLRLFPPQASCQVPNHCLENRALSYAWHQVPHFPFGLFLWHWHNSTHQYSHGNNRHRWPFLKDFQKWHHAKKLILRHYILLFIKRKQLYLFSVSYRWSLFSRRPRKAHLSSIPLTIQKHNIQSSTLWGLVTSHSRYTSIK